MAKNQSGRDEAGTERAPGRIDFRNRRERNIVNADVLISRVGHGAAPAAVGKGERFDRGGAETNSDVSVARARAEISSADGSVHDLGDSGARQRVVRAARDGGRDLCRAIYGSGDNRSELILIIVTTGRREIDVEQGERDVLNAGCIEGGKIDRHSDGLALIGEVNGEAKGVLRSAQAALKIRGNCRRHRISRSEFLLELRRVSRDRYRNVITRVGRIDVIGVTEGSGGPRDRVPVQGYRLNATRQQWQEQGREKKSSNELHRQERPLST